MNEQFAAYMKRSLDDYFSAEDYWRVFMIERGDKILVIATMLDEPEPIDESKIRELVIWKFSDTRRTAAIFLPNPPNWVELLAQEMAGNLFGQGVSDEMNDMSNAAARESENAI
jgi:hypothetical protein